MQDCGRVREIRANILFYTLSQFTRFVVEIGLLPQVRVIKESRNLWEKTLIPWNVYSFERNSN